jgi:glutamine synthetase
LRATFEARGYTVWDMSTPAFIKRGPNGSSLFIPTAFCSWTGEALDTKTPLLRSEEVVNREAVRLLHVLGHKDVESVKSTLGPEQEFFLIDRGYYLSRPDLVSFGRTVLGAEPPKGQEMEYHYFGAIDSRVLACLQEVEKHLWTLGIPVKTRHNEVAPCQFEMAPIYEHTPTASDHNMLMMDVLKEVASKHGLAALLHEKPFAYINGSGKHLNWSLETDKKENLLEPGATPISNRRFMVVLTAILRAVHINGDLLRSVIAVPGNSYRLGANEAPPVIISAYLGSELDAVCHTLMGTKDLNSSAIRDVLRLGVSTLPPLPLDSADRNRTSPFAFTGNKFEFRACGASQNTAWPVTVVNTIMAESLRFMADEIQKKVDSRIPLDDAINSTVIETLKKHYAIVFNGNGYSEEWVVEAGTRGLPILKHPYEALGVLDQPEKVDLFKNYGVLSPAETSARSLIMHEKFFEHMLIEAKTMVDLITTRVLPAAIKFQSKLASSYTAALTALGDATLLTNQKELLTSVVKLIDGLSSYNTELKNVIHHAEADGKNGDHRAALTKWYLPIYDGMPKVRNFSDKLEELIDDDLWPLPKYSDIFMTSK